MMKNSHSSCNLYEYSYLKIKQFFKTESIVTPLYDMKQFQDPKDYTAGNQ